jgi:hypothetical protein
MRKLLTSGLAISALLIAQTGAALADGSGEPEHMDKLGSALEHVAQQSEESAKAAQARGDTPSNAADTMQMGMAGPNHELELANVTPDGYVMIDAVASGNADNLAVTMESYGARNVTAYGGVVSAEFPANRLADLSASGYLAFAAPAFAETNVGLVTSQGDRSMLTDLVRADLGFDGTGLTIGILSDSFDCATTTLAGGPFTTMAEDIVNDDLPADINILADITSGCTDEGRAIGQLIHDVLPGAALSYHTAFNGQADFAQGIIDLAVAGADVIIDDVIYFTEPMFQDGIIAQAADEVSRLGIPYYSSNGNRARDAFQTDYRAVNATIDTTTGIWHDFDEGPGVDLLTTITFNGALQTNLSFQWDSPNFSVSGAPGAQNDVDVVMFDMAGVRVANCFPGGGPFVFPANGLCQFQFVDGGAGGDAVEFLSLVDFVGGSQVQIGFLTETGAAPGFVKFVIAGGGIVASEYPLDAPSGYGHNNAAGAEGVGAAAFYFTEEFIGDPSTLQLRALAGEPECIPACLNSFSSAGGTPILFDTAGNRLAEAEIRLKPGVTGPDGGNTSFFFSDTGRDDDDGDGVFQTGEPGEFPNFFGTSAAAPHVAALAGMLIQAEGSQLSDGAGFRMCNPDGDDDEGREHGADATVLPAQVAANVANGWLLGPCDRTEPHDIYETIRETAQDMTVRASNGTGATIMTFEENVVEDAHGFDFDSGFGFVDAVAALEEFLEDDDDDDDEDDDEDDDDDDDDDDDEDDD